MARTCEGPGSDERGLPNVGRDAKCGQPSTTSRRSWRWGDKTKGEDLIVKVTVRYCDRCASFHDDMKAEGEAEARCS